MLAICALLALIGLAISVAGKLGPGNPFSIFFSLWLCITVGLMATRGTFSPTSPYIWQLLATMLCVYLAFAVAATRGKRCAPASVEMDYRIYCLAWAQWAVLAVVPLLYLKATQLAGGSILSRTGYIALRTALIEEGAGGYGLLAYFVPLAFVVASIRLVQFVATRKGALDLIVSVGSAVAMAFLCTGRTFFLMMFCFLAFPLISTGKLKLRGAVILSVMLLASFIVVALLTRKGLDHHATLTANAESILKMLKVYVLSPTMAMAVVADGNTEPLALGGYSLRFFQILLTKLAGIEFESLPLIRDYVHVPDRVNVFTVMDPYFRDFGAAGVVGFAVASAALHFTLFRLMRNRGGPWVFIYSATLFPLVMQFFQDMYATLLSTWVQVFFWYMLFVRLTATKPLSAPIPPAGSLPGARHRSGPALRARQAGRTVGRPRSLIPTRPASTAAAGGPGPAR